MDCMSNYFVMNPAAEASIDICRTCVRLQVKRVPPQVQETRLQLKRQVQQLQSALESERSAAHTVAARVQHEQRRASAEYTAAETNIRQVPHRLSRTVREF